MVEDHSASPPGDGLGDDDEDIARRLPDTEPVVHIVALRRRHLRAVLRIETQVYPRPWSLALFMSELNLRTSRVYVGARVLGTIVGYAGLMFSGDEAHITNVAVDPAWQRHQVGSRLLAHLIRAALVQGVRHLTLEVRVSNVAAQGMYRRFGFEPAGLRQGYYAETNEDALIMWARDLDGPAAARRLTAIEAGIRGTTIVETPDGRPPSGGPAGPRGHEQR